MSDKGVPGFRHIKIICNTLFSCGLLYSVRTESRKHACGKEVFDLGKKNRAVNTAVFSAAHFITDFSCALLIFALVARTGELPVKLLLYNFCAFALQMPFGLIADKLNRNSVVAALGCVLTALACVFTKYPYMAAITAGTGNALFHVGGGLEVMNDCGGKYTKLGIFVAPGAFGLFLGTMLGKSNPQIVFLAALLPCVCAAFVLLSAFLPEKSLKSKNSPVAFCGTRGIKAGAALVCLFIVVVLRSYAGMMFAFPWKKGTAAVLFVLGVVLGKALGGVLSDKIGQNAASALSLAAACILFIFSDSAVCGILAVLLFNMTMPVTLGISAKILSGAKGFAFGILTFALFAGCLPGFLDLPAPLTGKPLYCAVCALSLVFLLLGARLSEDEKAALLPEMPECKRVI